MGYKIKLTNLISNPSFETATLWSAGTYDSSVKKYGNNSLRLDGNASVPEITSQNSAVIRYNPTHKFYGRYELYHNGAPGTAGIYFPIAEPSFYIRP